MSRPYASIYPRYLKLPAAEYRLSYLVAGRIARSSGQVDVRQFSPILSAWNLERTGEKARTGAPC